MKKVLYVAVADARGHLMKSILVKELLAEDDVRVDIITTSEEGRTFIRKFGHDCGVLDRAYLNKYDECQNLDVEGTSREIMGYLVDPTRFGKHVLELSFLLRGYDLAVNDSFNASMLAASIAYPRMVNVYVKNIMRSVLDELRGHPMLRAAFGLAHHRALMNVETTIKPIDGTIIKGKRMILNPLISVPSPIEKKGKLAVVYLNPLFTKWQLGQEIMDVLKERGYDVHAVGEGIAKKIEGWIPHDPKLGDKIAAADLVVSAPGMGVLSQVMAYHKRYIAVYTQQPEQQRNLRQVQNAANVRVLDVDAGEQSWRPQMKRNLRLLSRLPDVDISPRAIALGYKAQWRKVFTDLLKRASAR